MANYKETQVSGQQWQRACAIHIQNNYGQTPQITIQEEQLTKVGDELFQKGAGGISIAFDPNEVIALRHPVTGELMGETMTQGQIHVALWSLYMQKAAERDTPLVNAV